MKNIKRILSLLIALCMIMCLCACGGTSESANKDNDENVSNDTLDTSKDTKDSDTESDTDTEDATPVFNVTVVDANGAPVKGIMVQICKDACTPAMTNDEGIATFNMEITDGYKLSVMTPNYQIASGEAEIYLESGATEYTLTVTEVQ